jgi:hypothetical protein
LRGSRYDQKDCSVEVRLVINKKDFYNDTWTPNNTVLAVQNMVERIETQGSLQDVLHSSICWIVQNDTCLHYVDPSDWNTKRASALAKVMGVQYRFSQDRGFPTYEWVTRIVATTIWDR